MNSILLVDSEVTRIYFSYPFGSALPGRTWSDAGKTYRFGFNTQEKDDEVAGEGNSYTAEFWQYDTRLGRRWNLDIFPQINLSDFSVLANNPIFFLDVYGDRFADRYTRRQVRKQIRETKRQFGYQRHQMESVQKELNWYRDNPNARTESREEEITLLNITMSYMLIAMNELQNALVEIKEMKKSSIVYRIKKWNYNGKTIKENGEIHMYWNGKDRGQLAHELKHGFQYFNGEVNFDEAGEAGDAVDINDETDAYRREIAYSPGRTLVYDEEDGSETILSYSNLTNDMVRKLLPAYKDLPEQRKYAGELPDIKPEGRTNTKPER